MRYQAEGYRATPNKQSATTASPHFVKRAVPHAVKVLSSISICVSALVLCMQLWVCVYMCVCMCSCIHQTGNWQAADPLWVVFIFHSLPTSSHEAPALPLLFLFPSSSRSPPSIYLVIIVTWITSDREELGFENKSPAYKRQWKGNFIWIPTARAADEFAAAFCAAVFTFWVIFFVVVVENSRVWGGQGTWDDVCGEKIEEHFHLFLLRMKICDTMVELTKERCDRSWEHCTSCGGLINAQKMWVYECLNQPSLRVVTKPDPFYFGSGSVKHWVCR